MFVCPEDTYPRTAADFLGNTPGLPRTYAYNGYVGDNVTENALSVEGDLTLASEKGASLSELFLLVDQIMEIDLGTQVIGSAIGYTAYHDHSLKRFHGEDTAAITYADGHGESFDGYSGRYDDYWNGDLEGHALFKKYWCPLCSY